MVVRASKGAEAGHLPSGWGLSTIGELVEADPETLGKETMPTYAFNYIALENVNRGSLDSHVECVFSTAPVRARRKIRSGDILVATVRPNLQSHLLFSEAGGNWVCSTGFCVLRPIKGKVDARFLFDHIFSRNVTAQIGGIIAGSNYPAITRRDVQALALPLPPTIAEQQAIAEALGDVDGLLGGLDRLIAKKRDLKQAAMQQLLTGQTRLPGFRGEWLTKRLGEFGATYGGLTGKTKADFGEGAARYITFMNVVSNAVIDGGAFEPVAVEATESQNRAVKGDLFFNGSSETPEEVALCAVLLDEAHETYLNSFCFGFRLRSPDVADGLFLAYYLRSPEGREMMKSLAQGSTRYNISKTALLKAPLRLPSFSEQTAIAESLTNMDLEIAKLEQRREKTRAIKQAMMQELLTGRIRLV